MGPLSGVKIVEMVGIGPGPLAAMLLSDMGAEIIRIDRKGTKTDPRFRASDCSRGRRSIALDLKKPEAVETVLKLIEKADALLEGFRPGVMERLGLGPDIALKRNAKLVYGRVTGWGQTGPLSQAAGHDINYIAITGALHGTGEAGRRPVPPINLVGDFGGGTMFLVVGVLAGIIEARRSGHGQVVDAAMTDGAIYLSSMILGMVQSGFWKDERGVNLLDGGAHFYGAYETKDGKWVALGSNEAQFYAVMREKVGLTDSAFDAQMDARQWPALREKMTPIFKSKTRAEWCALLEGTDACFAPVMSWKEAPHHPHNKARESFISVEGGYQAAPAPRFSRTKSEVQGPSPLPGEHTEAALADWGIAPAAIAKLKDSGAI